MRMNQVLLGDPTNIINFQKGLICKIGNKMHVDASI